MSETETIVPVGQPRLVLPLLTDKQAAVMAFLTVFHRLEDRLPSTYELREYLGSSSQNAAMNYLRVLCQKGYLEHRTHETNARGWYRFSRQNAIGMAAGAAVPPLQSD